MNADNTKELSILKTRIVTSQEMGTADDLEREWESLKIILMDVCSMNEIAYRRWIEPLKFLEVSEEVVVMTCPDMGYFEMNYVARSFMSCFQEILSSYLGKGIEIACFCENNYSQDANRMTRR